MIKIYELLFEQDTTSTDSSSSSSTSSSGGMDPTKLGDVVKTSVEKAIKEPLSSIQAWIKQAEKEKATRPTPSKAEATSSTTTTTASGPSKPAGISAASNVSQKNDTKVASDISKNLTSNKSFLDTLASKIKDSMQAKK